MPSTTMNHRNYGPTRDVYIFEDWDAPLWTVLVRDDGRMARRQFTDLIEASNAFDIEDDYLSRKTYGEGCTCRPNSDLSCPACIANRRQAHGDNVPF